MDGIFFTLDTQTYIRYNYKYRTYVLCWWREINIYGSMVILHLDVKESDIRKLIFDTYKHTDSKIPLCENLIMIEIVGRFRAVSELGLL